MTLSVTPTTPILRSPLLERAGFCHAFPMRGASDVDLLRAVDATAVVQVRQVHGARALDATEAEDQEADALVARASALESRAGGVCVARSVVGVRVADCVPVLVADEATGDVAAIHAGWRGVVRGVVRAGIEKLGARSPVVAIGPCIGACCFEVGDDVAKQVGFVVRAHAGKFYVDLRAAVRAQLRALGVEDARIEDVPGCTKHEPVRFHSYRRDGSNSGRMLAAIAARN